MKVVTLFRRCYRIGIIQLANGFRSDHVNFNSATTPHHKLGCAVPSTFILTPESHFSNMPKLYYTPVTSGAASFIAAVVVVSTSVWSR
jgi:hypothetical protein